MITHRVSWDEWKREREEEIRRAQRKRDARGVLALFVAVSLAAVAWFVGPTIVDAFREPEAGYVTRKDHNPAWTQLVMTCRGYGSNGTCRGWYMVPVYHGESWRLKLREADGERSGWRSVSEGTYEKYELGEWYP